MFWTEEGELVLPKGYKPRGLRSFGLSKAEKERQKSKVKAEFQPDTGTVESDRAIEEKSTASVKLEKASNSRQTTPEARPRRRDAQRDWFSQGQDATHEFSRVHEEPRRWFQKGLEGGTCEQPLRTISTSSQMLYS